MIRVRVDDFPNTKGEPQHTLAAFRQFHRELTAHIGGKRYLLGVIPKRCDPDDILFLRNETDCVIGMHGIYHDEEKLDRYQNEFPPWLTSRDIGHYLMEAGAALQDAVGRSVMTYMPPRNRIDQRTVDVLEACAFIEFTTGPETDESLVVDGMLTAIPYTRFAYGRTDEMLLQNVPEQLIAACEEGGQPLLTLHWTWETNIGLEHMQRFFAKIPKKYFEDFDA